MNTSLLNDFLDGEHWQMWDSDNRSTGSAGIILQDPERFDRIMSAAEDGCEGSTHYEIIQDWRDAAHDMRILDPSDFDEEDPVSDGYVTDWDSGRITEEDASTLMTEIDECEAWHEKNGSLHQELG